MRCREAKHRLNRYVDDRSAYDRDDELQGHLDSCSACAMLTGVDQTLRRDMLSVSADDNQDIIPLAALRTRVESHARAAAFASFKENKLMSALTKQLTRSPRLSLSVGIAVLILAISALIPLRIDDTIGYEVAIAGVDPDLAMDSDRIRLLLEALGVGDAEFSVGDCEATCQVVISDLKSEGEVKVIVTAFDELGNCVLEEVRECTTDGSEPIVVALSSNRLFGTNTSEGDENLRQVILETLCDLDRATEGGFNIWVAGDSDLPALQVVICDTVACDSGFGFRSGLLECGEGMLSVKIEATEDGAQNAVVTTADGVVHHIDLTAPDAQEQLTALGVNFDLSRFLQHESSGCGLVKIIEMKGDSDEDIVVIDEDGVAKESVTELPEGYLLSQNYPNPFNPTTTIQYTLAQSERVTLEVYNVRGQKVRTLINGVVSAGDHSLEWNATDDSGNPVATGVYLYRLTAGDVTQTKKMTFMK